MCSAFGEPKLPIMGHQVAPEGVVRWMDQRNVGARNFALIELKWSSVIEIVVQCDQHNVSQKGALRKTAAPTDVLVIRRKMEALGGRITSRSAPENASG